MSANPKISVGKMTVAFLGIVAGALLTYKLAQGSLAELPGADRPCVGRRRTNDPAVGRRVTERRPFPALVRAVT